MISGLESDPLPDPLEKEMATHSSISCLENPMDRGAWQATVYGVTRVGHDLVTKPPPRIHVFEDISSMVQERNVLLNQNRLKHS